MDAKELFKNNYNISVEHSWCAYNGKDMVKFAKSYHQHRQAEEAQEKYERANKLITEANSDDNIISVIPFNKALRIAAGIEGKEEKE